MKRLLIVLFALLITFPAQAQENVTIADCRDGGCRCALGSVTAEEAGLVLGVAPPAGQQPLILVQYDGTYIWSTLTPEEADLAVGGDGQCPLELFRPIGPEDGQWQGRVTDRSVSQCPAALDAMLAPLTEAMAFPRDMRWDGVFHPDKIRMEGTAAAIVWTRVTDDHFTGTGPSGFQSSLSSLVSIEVTYDARLVDPRLVKIGVALDVRANGVSQAVIDAAGLGRCRVTVALDFAHLGR